MLQQNMCNLDEGDLPTYSTTAGFTTTLNGSELLNLKSQLYGSDLIRDFKVKTCEQK